MEIIQMLGNLGEFVGAIAVVATLVYLAIQVRHSKEAMEANTKSLDEGRKLALAQTYQARSDNLQQMGMFLAGSQELSEIAEKIKPEDASVDEYRTAYQSLTPVEQRRWRTFQLAHVNRMDNLVFQYQQGLMTEEYYKTGIRGPLAFFATGWEALGLLERRGRPSFFAEIENAAAESEQQS